MQAHIHMYARITNESQWEILNINYFKLGFFKENLVFL